MKIMLASQYDAADSDSWSGIPHAVATSLRKLGVDLAGQEPLPEGAWSLPLKSFQLGSRILSGTEMLRERHPLITASYARAMNQRTRRHRSDAILSLGTLPLANLHPESPPAFIWTGSTWASMCDYYPEFAHTSRRSSDTAHRVERAAIDNAAHIFAASSWARDSLLSDYAIAPDKVSVAPWGGPEPSAQTMPGPDAKVLRLLAVGRSWHRKGMDLACEVAAQIRDSGRRCQLDIVGALPPRNLVTDPDTRTHGWLSKRDPHQRRTLQALYSRATALLVLSRAEAYGQVINEAASIGLPTVASDTGGLGSTIRDYRLGKVVSLDESASRATAAILELVDNERDYLEMRESIRASYADNLTWRAVVSSVISIIERESRAPE